MKVKNFSSVNRLVFALATMLLISITGASVVAQPVQQPLEARGSGYIYEDGLQFKDLNNNDTLDPYEDWRLPVTDRVDNLLSQMTIEEKAGMMLINTLNADPGRRLPDRAVRYINEENMTRFIFRNPVTSNRNRVLRSRPRGPRVA